MALRTLRSRDGEVVAQWFLACRLGPVRGRSAPHHGTVTVLIDIHLFLWYLRLISFDGEDRGLIDPPDSAPPIQSMIIKTAGLPAYSANAMPVVASAGVPEVRTDAQLMTSHTRANPCHTRAAPVLIRANPQKKGGGGGVRRRKEVGSSRGVT